MSTPFYTARCWNLVEEPMTSEEKNEIYYAIDAASLEEENEEPCA